MDQLLISFNQLQAIAKLASGPLGMAWIEKTNLEGDSPIDAPTLAVQLPGRDDDDERFLVDRTGTVVRMHPQGMEAVDDPSEYAVKSS